MGRNKADGVVRTVDELTDEMKAKIEALYVGDGRTIRQVAHAMGIRDPVVSKYLRSKGLTRATRDYKSRSPWHKRQNETFAVNEAIRRRDERNKPDS